MTADAERIRHNAQRMTILKAVLDLVGVDREAGVAEILKTCDRVGYPMVPDKLDFHLRYMREWGWVKLRTESTVRHVDEILGARLTAYGVDRIDIGEMPKLGELPPALRREKK